MPKNDDFLRDFLREQRQEVRWRRDAEFRLLQFILAFYPIILVSMTSLYLSRIDARSYLLLSYGTSIFLIIFSFIVTLKICHEHKVHIEIGRDIQRIYSYFQLCEQGIYLEDEGILPRTSLDPKKGIGTGRGYIRTLLIIWIITVAVAAILLVLGMLKNPCTVQAFALGTRLTIGST